MGLRDRGGYFRCDLGRAMTKTASGMTLDEIVAQVSANSRLEGHELDEETLAVVRRIAAGEMTKADATAWRRARAERVTNA